MYVWTYTGLMGNGKTLGMVLEAVMYQQKTGCTLYSNFGVKGAKPFKSFNDFLNIAKEPSSVLLLDECHTDIDSRNSLSNAAKYWSHMAFYLRKMRCTLMLTTPIFSNVDSRFRDVTSVFVPVRKDKEYFYYPIVDNQSGILLKTKKMKKKHAFKLAGDVFETHSMVVPIEYPANKNEYESLLSQLREINDEYYTTKLKLQRLRDSKKAI
ncbi:hypothetical protein [Bacillus sp. K2I17]|uniref:hypothetical protein n=1 Tax=Bacillus sp. K2I17 TaxID=2014743 RepID=UPI000B5158C4|nr:hypothetical protein [Bacillus sp. K2I17]OWT47718.1 hypothetical protein CER22_29540 [Bacillus sp. K2I17]